MGKKKFPKVWRSNKLKHVESLLQRSTERVKSGVWEQPEWYDMYQRFPCDVSDTVNPQDELSIQRSRQMEEYLEMKRKPRSHPAQVLLDRMFERRPSFKADIFEDANDAKLNITQKYFNRMYELLEEHTSEDEAFALCDVEMKAELVEYEKSLIGRVVSEDAQQGGDVAHVYLQRAIDREEMAIIQEGKENNNDGKTTVGDNPEGFSLGRGAFYEPMPFEQLDVMAYEREVAKWYDRSKFAWANDWEGRISAVMGLGITQREMAAIQNEMRFATEHALKDTSTTLVAKIVERSLTIRRTGNQEPTDVCPRTGEPVEVKDRYLNLDDHRKLCHLVMYRKEALRNFNRMLSEAKTQYLSGPPQIEKMRIMYAEVWENVKSAAKTSPDAQRLMEIFTSVGLAMRVDVELDPKQTTENNNNETAAESPELDTPVRQKAAVFHHLLTMAKEERALDYGQDQAIVTRALLSACGFTPLREEQELREFLISIGRGDLCGDGKGELDAKGIKRLQKLPHALIKYLIHAENLCKDIEHLESQGDAPQTGRVRRSMTALQDLTDFIEEIQAGQFGRMFDIDDVMRCRDLYMETKEEGAVHGQAKQFLDDAWRDVEQLERFYLLNEGLLPTMTMSQFCRVAKSKAFLSRLIPFQEPLPFGPDEDPDLDLLREVGFGRLDEPIVQEAIKFNLLFPARVRAFILRGGGRRLIFRKIKPNLNNNVELEKAYEEDEKNAKRYAAFGRRPKPELAANRELYETVANKTQTESSMEKMQAKWEAAMKRKGYEIKEEEEIDFNDSNNTNLPQVDSEAW